MMMAAQSGAKTEASVSKSDDVQIVVQRNYVDVNMASGSGSLRKKIRQTLFGSKYMREADFCIYSGILVSP